MSNQDFLKLQAELDDAGKFTTIRKVDKKVYNLLVNYQIVLVRKQRRSLKSHVIKLHQENCPDSLLIPKKDATAEVL